MPTHQMNHFSHWYVLVINASHVLCVVLWIVGACNGSCWVYASHRTTVNTAQYILQLHFMPLQFIDSPHPRPCASSYRESEMKSKGYLSQDSQALLTIQVLICVE